MRILLHEFLPRRLKESLASHGCRCVPEAGWAGVKYGELPVPAENAGFPVFLTTDRGIEYQQNLADLRPQVPEVLRVLAPLEPGQLVKIGPGTNS